MQKNVAGQKIGGQIVSATDGSAFTGSVTVYVTGDAGTQAAGSVGSGACTHEGNGYHTYAPAQAETNYDLVAFTFIGTGAVPSTVQVFTGFPQTGDNYARLGAPAGASVSADVAAVKAQTAAIETDTQDLQTQVGTDGAGLTALPWNAAWDAEVQSEAADAITAAALATAANLATLAGYVDTEVAAILADTNELQTDLTDGGRLDLLIDAIKAKTDNLPSDPADQSAVEAAITSATSPLATGANLATLAGYVDTEVASILAAVDTEVAAILADTNELQTNQGNWLTADVSALATSAELAKVPKSDGAVSWNATAIGAIADGVLDEATAGHTTAGSFGKLVIDIGTVVSLLNTKIGAWTGTGVNTLLGAFKAALSKAATLPSDIGGTFDPAADSTEALRDRGDAAWITATGFATPTNITAASGVALTAAYDAAKTAATQTSVNDIPTVAEFEARTLVAADYVVVGDTLAAVTTVGTTTNLTNLPAAAALEATLTAIKGATFAGATDSLEALRDRGDAAWVTATGFATATNLATLAGYVDTEVAAILAAVDTEVAAIKAKTDNLPTDPADESLLEAAITSATGSLATAANLATLTGYVDTEVASIKVVTDKIDTALVLDGAVYQLTANALELAPTGGSAPSAADIRAEIDANSTQLAAIVADTNELQTNQGNWLTADVSGLATSAALATVDGIVDDILVDTGTTLPTQIALLSSAAGSGAISFPITVNDEDSNPIDGVEVWISTDNPATNIVAGTLSTDALGLATFMLDAGTYYAWRQKSGYNFTNPVAITVS